MHFADGYLNVARIRGVALRVHFSTPIGLFVVSGLSFAPWAWAGALLTILLHELGHAWLARRYRLTVVSIDLTGSGGVCRAHGYPSPLQEAVIAWGGVLAQGALVAAITVVMRVPTFGPNTVVGSALASLIVMNVILVGLNLLPIPPFDGAKAWTLFRLENLGRMGRRARLKMRLLSIERALRKSRPPRRSRAKQVLYLSVVPEPTKIIDE